MGDVNYAPVIQSMTWSYSRANSFDSCRYKWFLRYLKKAPTKDMFFASYGSFVHELIEQFYTEDSTAAELRRRYLTEFKQKVKGNAPSQKIWGNYFKDGSNYLKIIEKFPFEPVGIEKKVEFEIDGIPMVGYIDFEGRNEDGKPVIVDNKSRNLKPRSARAKPTKSDEELDSYLRQLYLYSKPVIEQTGEYPAELCFNCFRNGNFIREPFVEEKYLAAQEWFVDTVRRIEAEEEFKPNMDYFQCTYLCEVNDSCPYYEMNKKGRR